MVSNLLADVPVADFVPALDWHERLLGRPPDVSPLADERLAGWQLTDITALQVVDDLDQASAALLARGLPVGEVGGGEPGRGGLVRTAAVTDPAGNLLTLAGAALP